MYGTVFPYARPVISALAASMAGTADPPVKSMTGNGYNSHITNSNTIRDRQRG